MQEKDGVNAICEYLFLFSIKKYKKAQCTYTIMLNSDFKGYVGS